jgi:hypothetical protein
MRLGNPTNNTGKNFVKVDAPRQWQLNVKLSLARQQFHGGPINFWRCEKLARAGVLLRRQRGATPRSSPLRGDERGFDMIRLASLIALLLATLPVAAQTAGTSTSQVCTQNPTYCSDTGATVEHNDPQMAPTSRQRARILLQRPRDD